MTNKESVKERLYWILDELDTKPIHKSNIWKEIDKRYSGEGRHYHNFDKLHRHFLDLESLKLPQELKEDVELNLAIIGRDFWTNYEISAREISTLLKQNKVDPFTADNVSAIIENSGTEIEDFVDKGEKINLIRDLNMLQYSGTLKSEMEKYCKNYRKEFEDIDKQEFTQKKFEYIKKLL
jgi:predicted metal-dependent HD superfamily phosphohydrolase